MKKIFISLLSFLLILAVYTFAGGSLFALLVPTVAVTLFLGVFLSTLFSYSWSEIINAFRDSFSEHIEADRLETYRMSMQVVKNMESATTLWSLTVVILATIFSLSTLAELNHLGPKLAMGFCSLLYGFGTRTLLLTPMKNSICKKVFKAKE